MSAPSINGLPPVAADLAQRLEAGEMLGATRNLVAIGNVLATVAATYDDQSVLHRAVDYFRSTRGREARAVANGLDLLTAALPPGDLAACLERRANWFSSASDRWTRDITSAAIARIGDGARVIAFDYSSVVAAVLHQGYQQQRWRIIVPESRALDGGRPYLEDLGSQVVSSVVPDAALGRETAAADVVLIGAETCFEDGSCHNTLGSLTAALCARHFEVPFLVVTPLLKFAGKGAPSAEGSGERDFGQRFGAVPGVLMTQPENERVPAELITTYLTEMGEVAPEQLAETAERALQVSAAELLSV